MATFLGLLPIILHVLGYVLKWYGASEDTLKAYDKLVAEAAKSNLISVNMRDRILSQREKIKQRQAEKAKGGQ